MRDLDAPSHRMRHACDMAPTHGDLGRAVRPAEELGSLAARASHRSLHQGLECSSSSSPARRSWPASPASARSARRMPRRSSSRPARAAPCSSSAPAAVCARRSGPNARALHDRGAGRPGRPNRAGNPFRPGRCAAAWREVASGPEGWFLTADRPVLSLWRRLRLARAFAGPCVAEMETAAAAAVAVQAGVPWAALRTVTDRATLGGIASFRRHYPTCASLAADTVERLVTRLERGSVAPGRPPR
jgi:hypothetical protein